jgi:hypothetical protein
MAKRFPKLIGRLKAAHGAWSRPRPRKPALDVSVPRACAPPELAGQWVAYSGDGRRIIASGTTFTEVFEKVQQATTEAVSFEKLPSLDRRLF